MDVASIIYSLPFLGRFCLWFWPTEVKRNLQFAQICASLKWISPAKRNDVIFMLYCSLLLTKYSMGNLISVRPFPISNICFLALSFLAIWVFKNDAKHMFKENAFLVVETLELWSSEVEMICDNWFAKCSSYWQFELMTGNGNSW